MSILGHIWAVLVNLFVILVVIGMFNAAHTRFETLVVAALTIIYLQVIWTGTSILRTMISQDNSLFAQFAMLAKLLNDPEFPKYESIITETETKIANTNTRYYINLGFAAILWIIALWQLVTTALS